MQIIRAVLWFAVKNPDRANFFSAFFKTWFAPFSSVQAARMSLLLSYAFV